MSPRLRFHRTQGQSVVLVALAIFVLIALAGLGLDGANAFNQRRNVANAADAAAMAGTNTLIAQRKSGSSSNTPICQAISDYINNHDLNTGVALSWTASYVNSTADETVQFCDSSASPVATSTFASSSDRGVSVTIHYTFGTMFMGILGRNDLSVGGTGTAVYGPASSYTGSDVVPFAVSQAGMASVLAQNGGQNAYINTTNLGTGNFGSVMFNPISTPNNGGNDCNSSTYLDTLSYYWCNGSPKYPVYSGEQLWVKPGAVATSLATEIGTRKNQVMIVPIYSGNAGNGSNAQMTVVGFMSVRLNSYDLNGGNPNDRWFNVDYVGYTTTTGAFSNGAVDGGVYAINLVH